MYRVIPASKLARGVPRLLRRLERLSLDSAAEASEAAAKQLPDGPDGPAADEPGPGGEAVYNAGYRDGYEAGREAALHETSEQVRPLLEKHQAQADSMVRALEGAVQQAGSFEKWARAHYRCEAVGLALLIARRVLLHELSVRPAVLLEVMDELLRNEESPVLQEIRVAPGHQQAVVDGLELLQKYTPDGVAPRVLADPEIEAGFVLVTDRGGIDARLDTQLSRIGEHLEREMRDEEQ